jgi:hypothetical protein
MRNILRPAGAVLVLAPTLLLFLAGLLAHSATAAGSSARPGAPVAAHVMSVR